MAVFRFSNLLMSEDKSSASLRPRYAPAELSLTVVIPAMNEEKRLPTMLEECLEYCKQRKAKAAKSKPFTYEVRKFISFDLSLKIQVIVVDDGSTDSTADLAASYAKDNVKVMRLEENIGKGMLRLKKRLRVLRIRTNQK